MSKETFKSDPLSVSMLGYSNTCPKRITKGTCVNQARPTKEPLPHVCHYDRAMSLDSSQQYAAHARSTELQEIYKGDILAIYSQA